MPHPTVKKLTEADKARLKKHALTHSDRYMRSMRMQMVGGKTFEQADAYAKAKYKK